MFVLLRYLPLIAGCIALMIGWYSWQAGTPPPYSLFSPRARVIVASVRIETRRIGNGTLRHDPVVEVYWPPDSRELASVQGLLPDFQRGSMASAKGVQKIHVAGETIRVRIVDGAVHADRTDLFHISHAMFMTIMGLFILLAGLLVLFPAGLSVLGALIRRMTPANRR